MLKYDIICLIWIKNVKNKTQAQNSGKGRLVFLLLLNNYIDYKNTIIRTLERNACCAYQSKNKTGSQELSLDVEKEKRAKRHLTPIMKKNWHDNRNVFFVEVIKVTVLGLILFNFSGQKLYETIKFVP